MRKKFFRTAIATLAATFVAALGCLFVQPKAPETPDASAAGNGVSCEELFNDATLDNWNLKLAATNNFAVNTAEGNLAVTTATDGVSIYSKGTYDNVVVEFMAYSFGASNWIGFNYSMPNGTENYWEAPLIYITQAGEPGALNAKVEEYSVDVLPFAAQGYAYFRLEVVGSTAVLSWYNDGAETATGYVKATTDSKFLTGGQSNVGHVAIPATANASMCIDNLRIGAVAADYDLSFVGSTTGTLLQTFDQAELVTKASDTSKSVLSPVGATHGAHSNAITLDSGNNWVELHINLGVNDISSYESISFDYYTPGGLKFYSPVDEGATDSDVAYKAARRTVTWTVEEIGAQFENGILKVVFCGTTGNTFYIDNVRAIGSVGGGDVGGGDVGGGTDVPVINGTPINDFAGPYSHTIDTNSVRTEGVVSTTGVVSGTSNELSAATEWCYVYLSVGSRPLSLLQDYATISFTVYSTVGTGWQINQTPVGTGVAGQTSLISFDVATLVENQATSFLNVDGSNFIVFAMKGVANTPIYVANLQVSGVGTGSGDDSGDVGGDDSGDVGGGDVGGGTVTEGDVLQSFDTVAISTDATGVASVETSTQHATEGTYSNMVKATATQWFDLKITLAHTNYGSHNAVQFDYYAASGGNMVFYYGGVEHAASSSGTYTLPLSTFKSMLLTDNVFKITCCAPAINETFYIDNLRLVTDSSIEGDGGDVGGGDVGGDVGGTDTPVINGSVLNDFEGVYSYTIDTANLTKNAVVSTTGVTEGSHSNELSAATGWYNVYLAIGSTTLNQLQQYATISFTSYSTAANNWHIAHMVVGNGVAGNTTTISFDVATLVANQSAFVSGQYGNYIMFVVQGAVNTPVYVDNLQVSGTGTVDPTPPAPEATGGTQYTKFEEALDTSKWFISNSSTTKVEDGKLNFTSTMDGDAFASVGTYTNFVLEYDVYGLSCTFVDGTDDKGNPIQIPQPSLGWLGVGFGADDTLNYANNKMVFFTFDTINPHNFTGNREFIGNIYTATEYVHIRLEAQDGTVKVGYGVDGGAVTMYTLGVGLNTTGRVYIPTVTNSTYKIDNLVLINSDEWAEYEVEKKILNSYSMQVSAGAKASGKVDLGDLTSSFNGITGVKTVKFIPSTKGLVMDENTGAWEITAPTKNGGHSYFYNVVISDFVIDGWINPLGSRGDYLLAGTIVLNVMGGEGEDVEGGAGDTTYLPTLGVYDEEGKLVTEETGTRENIVAGKGESVSFIIDCKGKDIISVNWYRSMEEQGALTEASYTYDKETHTFTLKAEYIDLLPGGKTSFTVATAKGSVQVHVVVVAQPKVEGETHKEVDQYSKADVTFSVDLGGEALDGISAERGTIAGLNENAYTYDKDAKTLTIKGAYIATLPAGLTTFYINTRGGRAYVSINVKAIPAPSVAEEKPTNHKMKLGSAEEDVIFYVNLKGVELTRIVVKSGDDTRELQAEYCEFNQTAEIPYVAIKKAYVNELLAGVTYFTFETKGGSVTVTIEVEGRKAPELIDTKVPQITQGAANNVQFSIDCYGEEITVIEVVRDNVENQQLTESSFKYEAGFNSLTIYGDYLKQLPAGDVKFVVYTTGGYVEVSLVIDSLNTPSVSEATKTVKEGYANDVVFDVDTHGQEILAVLYGGDQSKALELGKQYKFANNKLTLLGNYVATLPAGENTFVIITITGPTTLTVMVEDVEEPKASETQQTITKGYNDVVFGVEISEDDALVEVLAVRGETTTKLLASNYSYDMDNKTLTLFAAYVGLLPLGDTMFIVKTVVGDVELTLTVEDFKNPEFVGEEDGEEEISKGDSKSLTFEIDTFGQDILAILRGSETNMDQALDASMYTLDKDAKTLTINGEYLAQLTVDTEFVIITAGGNVKLTIKVKTAAAPTTTENEDAPKTAKHGEAKDLVFNVNTNGEEILAIRRDSKTSQALNKDAYAYADGKLTLLADYVKRLPQGKMHFLVTTAGGEVTIYVEIEAVDAPTVDVNEKETIKGIEADVAFAVNTYGSSILAILRGGNEGNALIEDAYSYSDGTLTFAGEYLAQLTVDTEFVIVTAGGSVTVTIKVKTYAAPEATKDAATMKVGKEQNVTFEIDTKGAAILAILRDGKNDQALMEEYYSYENGVLTIKAAYVSKLLVGETKFDVLTAGGAITVTITVEPIPAPVVVEPYATAMKGAETAVSFEVDTADEAILAILRDGNANQKVKADYYSYNNGVLTFAEEYVKNLAAGDTTFDVLTAGGKVTVTITLNVKAVINGASSLKAEFGVANAVAVYVDTYGERPTIKEGKNNLSAANYTYVDGVLTLSGDYVKNLEVGKYTYTIVTSGSDSKKPVTFTLTIYEVRAELDRDENKEGSDVGSGNIFDPEYDWGKNWTGDIKPNTNGNFAQGYQGIGGCNNSVGAMSGLALIGAAVAAILLKKKQD